MTKVHIPAEVYKNLCNFLERIRGSDDVPQAVAQEASRRLTELTTTREIPTPEFRANRD